MKQLPYNRVAAVEYAQKWAFLRNPKFFNFDGLGGDCTNFVSQCIYAGSGARKEFCSYIAAIALGFLEFL